MTHQQLVCWLVLHRIAGSSRTLSLLLDRFGSAQEVFAAGRSELSTLLESKTTLLDAIAAGADECAGVDAAAVELEWLAQPHCHVVTRADVHYPPLLREIADPPPLLFVRGVKEVLTLAQIAVVGSRNPTPTGCENAHGFARTLAQMGLVISSGLALGIDACAHRGALEAGGLTIAVAATGLDRVYPARHRELAHAITQHGALISEFPLGSPPRRDHFPRRNRIISGMSTGVLVVEAALQSGSLITARLAVEQGREVFAIPGSIHSPLARGCHVLIRQGAKLVETAQDIVEELGPLLGAQAQQADSAIRAEIASVLPEGQQEFDLVLVHVGHDPMSVDALVDRSGLTPEVISSMLLQMELYGLVEACPGGKYQRKG